MTCKVLKLVSHPDGSIGGCIYDDLLSVDVLDIDDISLVERGKGHEHDGRDRSHVIPSFRLKGSSISMSLNTPHYQHVVVT